MKADRLISILMLLQVHKQLTASELSKRLEVSIRTIYRDIDTISGMGIPIITDRGNGGGVQLLGGYKSSLTGLTSDELKYLAISPSNKILGDLGIESPKKSTFLKLLNGVNSDQRKEVENILEYIYIDMDAWSTSAPSVDLRYMTIIQNAICKSKILEFIYKKTDDFKEVTLKPLGLVCKKGTWYLIGINEGIVKTYKLSSIESVNLIDVVFERPADFSLENYWKESVKNFKQLIPKHLFKFKVTQSAMNHIKERKFINIKDVEYKGNEILVEIEFDSIWKGLEFAFGYGKEVLILQPKEAIYQIKSNAMSIIDLYK